MRLLWHSNAPWSSTGYGQQTALFLPRLNEHYKVACSAFYGLEAAPLPWKGIPTLPGIGVTHGNEVILDHAGMFFDGLRGGIVFTLMDVWVLDPSVWRKLNVCSWVPVDHQPVPRPVVNFFTSAGAVPIAMSRFGQEQLEEAGLDPLYVPHALDTSIYKPRENAREEIKLPTDAFIVGMVAANKGDPSRKCFVEAFQAFKAFQAKHSEAVLYLHTEARGRFSGVDLAQLATELGIKDSLIFCDQYRAVHYPFEHETMAKLYSAMDVLLMPSAGEGFGLPAVEAQACGTPVIASDFSAQPETVGCGWLVKGTPVYTGIKSWQVRPDIEDIVDSLDRAYSMLSSDAGREEACRKGVEHAAQYDIETVFAEHMLPALEQVQERFEMRKPMKVAA